MHVLTLDLLTTSTAYLVFSRFFDIILENDGALKMCMKVGMEVLTVNMADPLSNSNNTDTNIYLLSI
jgi:hypothetical protein